MINIDKWREQDKIMAKFVKEIGIVPPKTFDAICNQQWLFSTRMKASQKLGVRKMFNDKTGKFYAVLLDD